MSYRQTLAQLSACHLVHDLAPAILLEGALLVLAPAHHTWCQQTKRRKLAMSIFWNFVTAELLSAVAKLLKIFRLSSALLITHDRNGGSCFVLPQMLRCLQVPAELSQNQLSGKYTNRKCDLRSFRGSNSTAPLL